MSDLLNAVQSVRQGPISWKFAIQADPAKFYAFVIFVLFVGFHSRPMGIFIYLWDPLVPSEDMHCCWGTISRARISTFLIVYTDS